MVKNVIHKTALMCDISLAFGETLERYRMDSGDMNDHRGVTDSEPYNDVYTILYVMDMVVACSGISE